jgi:hypothetical protein
MEHPIFLVVGLLAGLVGIVAGIAQVYDVIQKRRKIDQIVEQDEPEHLYQAHGVSSRYEDFIYHFGDNSAASIRLVGAGSEFFSSRSVRVIPDRTPYQMPGEFLLVRKRVIERLEREAKPNGTLFFDGPHTRLVDYRMMVPQAETGVPQKKWISG